MLGILVSVSIVSGEGSFEYFCGKCILRMCPEIFIYFQNYFPLVWCCCRLYVYGDWDFLQVMCSFS